MTVTHHFTPGLLVVTLQRYPDESAVGYILRLSEANGYLSSKTILRLLEEHSGKSIRFLHELASDVDVLSALEDFTGAPTSSLSGETWKPIDSASGPYFNVRGAPIPFDALMTEHAQVCPICLAENAYIKENWELSGVTVCPVHAVALLDHCPACNRVLKVMRTPLVTCGHCQFDLRQSSTLKASPNETILSEHVAALAPYRIKLGAQIIVDDAEGLFALGQTMSFDTQSVIEGHWKERHFQHLSVTDRREALRPVAFALDGYVIDGLLLHRVLLAHIAHRLPYLPRDLALQPLIVFLQENRFLSPKIRKILSYGGEPPGKLSAAEHFNLRPPQFHEERQVMAFLDCSEAAWNWLLRQGHIHMPGTGYGFDADEILAAKDRLAQFLSLEDMDIRFGVTNLTQCLIDWHVLPVATSSKDLWTAVDLTVVGKILDWLRLRSTRNPTDQNENWVRVNTTQLAQANLAETYATVIARALRSDIAALRWDTPYSYGDLYVTAADAERLDAAYVDAIDVTTEFNTDTESMTGLTPVQSQKTLQNSI